MTDWWELDPNKERRRLYMQEYRQKNRSLAPARPRKNAKKPPELPPFVGVDGEGGQMMVDGVERHCYWLLRIGENVLRSEGDNRPLSSEQCLDFICEQDPHKIYVGYFLGYDFTKILEGLPEERLRRLMNSAARRAKVKNVILPLDWGDYQIDLLMGKELKVRKLKGVVQGKRTYTPWVVLNDVGSFFQCSFLKAIKLWSVGTEEEHKVIEEGKAARADFGEGTEDVVAYNALEVRLLETLMEKFRDSCGVNGVYPRKWQGPGQLAEAAFRKFGFPLSKNIEVLKNTELVQFANNSFYGGRPEFMAFGPVEREVYQYDINSAYPASMLHLPCLEHGEWSHKSGEGVPYASFAERDGYALCYGTFEATEPSLWYGLPIRDKNGSISYPAAGGGWYWNFEIDASPHQEFRIEDAWVYERKCDCQPMDWVEDLYWERKRMGKNGPGMVVKLLLNSLYGKMCQSVGSPKYANPIYASFITSYCRTMLQHFIHSSPSCQDGMCGIDVLGVATDSVMTWRKREDIKITDRLGEWSEEVHPDGMLLVQPGVYFGSSGKGPKTRGFNQAAVWSKEAEFREAFQRVVDTGELADAYVVIPQRMFVGIRAGLHRNKPELIGQWVDYSEVGTGGKVIHFDWTTKRALQPVGTPGVGVSYISTKPKDGCTDTVSVPYSRDIGALQTATLERELWEGMPDDSWRLFD